MRRIRPILFCTLVLAAAAVPATARAADPVADLNAQYQTVLSVIKRPTVSGVLVTEVLPDSAAAAEGLRAGDIITHYYGKPVGDLQSLREQVADAIAGRLQDHEQTRVQLRGRRAGVAEELSMRLPREPLGIRAIEVIAGVPGPRNPQVTLRGELKLDWKGVLDMLHADGGVITLRTQETPRAEAGRAPATGPAARDPLQPAPDTWLGWQKYEITTDGDGALSATFDIVKVEAVGSATVTDTVKFSFRLEPGDFSATPAFLLTGASGQYPAEDHTITATASRLGDSLRVTRTSDDKTAAIQASEFTAPLSAIIQPAVPIVAAAMPHEIDAGLAVHLVSVRDFLPRPGYVLTTRGKQPLPPLPVSPGAATAPAETAWRVDLVHFGVLIESYWFSDQRRLLCVQSGAGTGGSTAVVSRRVINLADAQSPAELKSATRP